jgi:beta-lactamase class A
MRLPISRGCGIADLCIRDRCKACGAPTALVLWFFGNGAAGYRRSRTCFSALMRFAIVFFLLATSVYAQTTLRRQIRDIAVDARGKVSVACGLPDSSLNCDLDPQAHPPMQSVFKLPLAVTALHLVEQGRFSLDQPVRFLPSDRILPHTHSPLQDKYPEGNVNVPLRELLRLEISESDNVATDIVLRTVGGPAIVNECIRSLGVQGFHLEDDEQGLARDVAVQYRNWFEPAGAVQLLRRISEDSPLTAEHTRMLLQWMQDAASGTKRIKGALPAGTIVMHKTGTSGTRDGVTFATNDVGLIALPDGRRLAIAIFVTDSKADDDTRDAVIARIGKAAYDESTRTKK